MTDAELNALANEAKTNDASMWEIKAHYMKYIERLAQDNWYKMNNEAHFIDDCNRKIEYAVRSFNEELGDFSRRVYYLLHQSLRHYCSNRGGKRKVLQLLGEVLDAIDMDIHVEEEALSSVVLEEMCADCDREIDAQILEIIFDKKDHVENQSDITRKLVEKTGRSYNSARGCVRSFAKRKRAV